MRPVEKLNCFLMDHLRLGQSYQQMLIEPVPPTLEEIKSLYRVDTLMKMEIGAVQELMQLCCLN